MAFSLRRPRHPGCSRTPAASCSPRGSSAGSGSCCCSHALGIEVGLGAALVYMIVTGLANTAPILPGNAGVYQGAAIGALALVGEAGSKAIAVGLVAPLFASAVTAAAALAGVALYGRALRRRLARGARSRVARSCGVRRTARDRRLRHSGWLRPQRSRAGGKMFFEDTVPSGRSSSITITTHHASSFTVLLRVPTAGRAKLFLLGKHAPKRGLLIDTKTFACDGAAGSFYCKASYEPLPQGTYTWKIAWVGKPTAPAHVELTVRW